MGCSPLNRFLDQALAGASFTLERHGRLRSVRFLATGGNLRFLCRLSLVRFCTCGQVLFHSLDTEVGRGFEIGLAHGIIPFTIGVILAVVVLRFSRIEVLRGEWIAMALALESSLISVSLAAWDVLNLVARADLTSFYPKEGTLIGSTSLSSVDVASCEITDSSDSLREARRFGASNATI